MADETDTKPGEGSATRSVQGPTLSAAHAVTDNDQPATRELLVLGIGNILFRDDGVGVRVAELVGREHAARPTAFPPGTRIVDGGTLGLDLLPMVQDARAVVFLDAVDLGGAPGEVTALRGSEVGGRLGGQLSVHQVGLADLLGAASLAGRLPGLMAVVGIQPADVEVGLELSPAVALAVPRAAEMARLMAWELQRALGRRSPSDPGRQVESVGGG